MPEGEEPAQAARERMAEQRNRTTKMEEKVMAILGGLLRSSMCRWMDGRALKKEQPGMSNVWIIIGL